MIYKLKGNENNIIIENYHGVCPANEDSIKLAESASRFPKGSVLDMGTGTGFIGIYLSKAGFVVDAVDNSEKALKNAAQNAKLNNVDMNIFYSSLFENIRGNYDLIIFNPPLNPNEGKAFQFIGSIIRKSNFLTNISLPIVKGIHGNNRLDFVINFVDKSQSYLKTGGTLLLFITDHEAKVIQIRIPNVKIKWLASIDSIQEFFIACISFS